MCSPFSLSASLNMLPLRNKWTVALKLLLTIFGQIIVNSRVDCSTFLEISGRAKHPGCQHFHQHLYNLLNLAQFFLDFTGKKH